MFKWVFDIPKLRRLKAKWYYKFHPNDKAKFKARHLCSTRSSKDSVLGWQWYVLISLCLSNFILSQIGKVPVQRVMWESLLSFLGAFILIVVKKTWKFFCCLSHLNLCVSKIKKIESNFCRGWGRVEWLLTCDFWVLNGVAAWLPSTARHAEYCREDSPKMHVRHHSDS